MGILANLIWLFLNLLCIGVDIATFFVLVRLVSMWRKIPWLEELNDIGKRLVDPLAVYAGKLWYKATQRRLSIKGELLLGLVALLLVRAVLS